MLSSCFCNDILSNNYTYIDIHTLIQNFLQKYNNKNFKNINWLTIPLESLIEKKDTNLQEILHISRIILYPFLQSIKYIVEMTDNCDNLYKQQSSHLCYQSKIHKAIMNSDHIICELLQYHGMFAYLFASIYVHTKYYIFYRFVYSIKSSLDTFSLSRNL